MTAQLEKAVRERARGLCEYCQASQAHYPERFHIDHIVAQQHRGTTSFENLALCCMECNRRKGPNITSVDPLTGERADLFHPRQDVWHEHFEWQGAVLHGLTPVGRATVALLEINRPPRVMVREALIDEGVFPPAADRPPQ
jgi:hypothetical protein